MTVQQAVRRHSRAKVQTLRKKGHCPSCGQCVYLGAAHRVLVHDKLMGRRRSSCPGSGRRTTPCDCRCNSGVVRQGPFEAARPSTENDADVSRDALMHDHVRVQIRSVTAEQRKMILNGLRMIRGVVAVEDPEQTDEPKRSCIGNTRVCPPSEVFAWVEHFAPNVGSAMCIIEGVTRATLLGRKEWIPF